jgi:lysophospholipase L1-like esterase
MVNLAKKYDAGMWDLFEIMGGLGSIKTWEAHDLAKRDRIHFTGEGYKLLGDLMFAALMGEYERHLKSTNATSAKP